MKRLVLIIVGLLGTSIGVFLLRNWIGGDLSIAGKSFSSGAFSFFLNWVLRILFFGGGIVTTGIGLFGSEQLVAKAFRGFRGAI